jgi:hypothetical protein
MDDGLGDVAQNVAGEWIGLGEFARRLGISRSSVYGRVRRRSVQVRARNGRNHGLEIFWQPSRHHRGNGSDVGLGDGLGDDALRVAGDDAENVAGNVVLARLDKAEHELAAARAQVADLRVQVAIAQADREAARAVAIADVATAQAEVTAKDQIIADLREQVQWLRLPWWRRLFGP